MYQLLKLVDTFLYNERIKPKYWSHSRIAWIYFPAQIIGWILPLYTSSSQLCVQCVFCTNYATGHLSNKAVPPKLSSITFYNTYNIKTIIIIKFMAIIFYNSIYILEESNSKKTYIFIFKVVFLIPRTMPGNLYSKWKSVN